MGDLEVALQADGALLLVGALGDDGALVRLTLEPTGSTSLTLIRGDAWSTASVEAGPATSGGRLVRVRSARGVADGGVEGRLTLRCATGEQFNRELLIEPGGERRWTGERRLPDGFSWTEEGAFDGTVARIRRRALDADGAGLWSEERTTTFEGDPAARPARASTVAERTYDSGERSTIRRLAHGDDGPLRGEARIAFFAEDGKPGATRESRTVAAPDGSTTTETVTVRPDGETLVETTTRWIDASATATTEAADTTFMAISPEGLAARQQMRRTVMSERTPDDSRWGSVITTIDGATGETESGVGGEDGHGVTSEAISHIFGDGSMEITTRTSQGGTESITTTRVDAAGGTETSSIEATGTTTIGPPGGGGGSPGGGGGEGGGTSGPGEGGTGGEGGTDGECPDDGDATDCIPKMKEPYGEDSPSRVLPEEVGRLLGGLRGSRLASADEPLAARIAAGVRNGLRTAPVPVSAPVRRGDTGRTALALDGVPAPPGWDELHDPVKLVDFTLRTTAALARTGTLPVEAVHRALLACGRLTREVACRQADEQERA